MISQEKLEETLSKLRAHEGVKGIVVTNLEGLPITSDLDPDTTEHVAALITSLVGKAIGVTKALNRGKLSFLTLDTTEGKVLVAPEDEYVLIVLK